MQSSNFNFITIYKYMYIFKSFQCIFPHIRNSYHLKSSMLPLIVINHLLVHLATACKKLTWLEWSDVTDLYLSVSLFRTRIKASLGTSTLPIFLINLLPSACLFKSFILLVMSPPYCEKKKLLSPNYNCSYSTFQQHKSRGFKNSQKSWLYFDKKIILYFK